MLLKVSPSQPKPVPRTLSALPTLQQCCLWGGLCGTKEVWTPHGKAAATHSPPWAGVEAWGRKIILGGGEGGQGLWGSSPAAHGSAQELLVGQRQLQRAAVGAGALLLGNQGWAGPSARF